MRAFVYAAIPLFSEITVFYGLFLLFSNTSEGGMMNFSFPLYLLCALMAVLINRILVRRDHRLITIALINIALILTAEFVMFYAPNDIRGVFSHIITALMFIYPAVRGLSLARKPADAPAMLTRCDILFLFTGIFLCLQIPATFRPGILPNFLCIISLALNIAALSSIRARADGRLTRSVKNRWQRIPILILAAAIPVIITSVLAFLLLPTAMDTLMAAVFTVRDGILWALGMLWHGMEYLASLIPYTGAEIPGGMAEPPADVPVSESQTAEEALPEWLPLILAAAGAAVVISLLVYILIKFRRAVILRSVIQSNMPEERDFAPSLLSMLREMLIHLREKLRFYSLVILKFDSCAGVFVRLELYGKRHGYPRHANQTPYEFLLALSQRSGNTEAQNIFTEFACEVNKLCFADCKKDHRVTHEKIRIMKAALREKK